MVINLTQEMIDKLNDDAALLESESELTEEEFDELHSATQPCSSDNQNTLPF